MDAPRLRPPLFPGCLLLLLLPLLLDGLVVFQTYAVDVEVKDESNISCLYAKWMVKLSVTYEGIDDYKTSTFMFPDDVSYVGSSCGNQTTGPVLSVEFGKGNSWTIHFTKTKDTYQGVITFTYNTKDAVLFPDAKKKEPVTVSTNYPANPIRLNTVFSCSSEDTVKSGNVTLTFQNVTLQAFLQDGSLSSQKTLCDNDATMSTISTVDLVTKSLLVSPAGTAMTTEFNATGNSSSPLPSIPPEEKPGTGSYNVKSGAVTCLLASLGLQLNITQQVPLIINFNPNTTLASGHCGQITAVLQLTDGNHKVDFLFAVKNTTSEKFYLKGMDITVVESTNATLSATNHTLNNWETTMGNSYLCRKEESIVVSPGYRVNIFDLKIQPFGVDDGQFSAAEDCVPEVDNFFVPLLMTIALIGLVWLVVMAYCTRTQRSAGYRQF
ncbi:lysosome-associated membrane glycoprotein 2 isoform 2-T3 [Liasis olivaceus]